MLCYSMCDGGTSLSNLEQTWIKNDLGEYGPNKKFKNDTSIVESGDLDNDEFGDSDEQDKRPKHDKKETNWDEESDESGTMGKHDTSIT